ncbi:MAG: hypothetical protein HN353_06905 [Bdellovibrionales bacterium]|jgi:hypothetical protein|nr:hypothetical protein [Bdellovibrionales bacterium]MBT3525260.1 hypothetical protein [Bdellovibrionales bacterium]MBT7669407.1 hypothetical protein [Bdellovibrionales bacterium]MBT7765625.1 hypothetical protein [Bdellovibrionales bacterium]
MIKQYMTITSILILITLSFTLHAEENRAVSGRLLPFTSSAPTLILSDFPEMQDQFEKDQAYFEIVSVELTETTGPYCSLIDGEDSSKEGISLGAILTSLDKLIAIGKKLWSVAESGRPVIQTNFTPIHVLPKALGNQLDTFHQMEYWSNPEKRSYQVVFKNGFGVEAVRFNFSVTYQAGGRYNGVGRYLTGVNVVPDQLSVSWGFHFTAESKFDSITNHGSSEDPIAGATMTLTYRTKTIMKDITSSATFHVRGDGQLTGL